MDQSNDILTVPTVALALGIYITAFTIRRSFEVAFPTLSTKTPVSRAQIFWEGLILPTMPAMVGSVFCVLAKTFPFPTLIGQSHYLRVFYGLGLGWFSSWGYKVVRFVVQKKWNIPFPDDSIRPGPLPLILVEVPKGEEDQKTTIHRKIIGEKSGDV